MELASFFGLEKPIHLQPRPREGTGYDPELDFFFLFSAVVRRTLLLKPGWRVEREALRDFALLQLILHYRGGVSLTSIPILSPGRAFSQVIRFPAAFSVSECLEEGECWLG